MLHRVLILLLESKSVADIDAGNALSHPIATVTYINSLRRIYLEAAKVLSYELLLLIERHLKLRLQLPQGGCIQE